VNRSDAAIGKTAEIDLTPNEAETYCLRPEAVPQVHFQGKDNAADLEFQGCKILSRMNDCGVI
jgi:hypothetical protein